MFQSDIYPSHSLNQTLTFRAIKNLKSIFKNSIIVQASYEIKNRQVG